MRAEVLRFWQGVEGNLRHCFIGTSVKKNGSVLCKPDFSYQQKSHRATTESHIKARQCCTRCATTPTQQHPRAFAAPLHATCSLKTTPSTLYRCGRGGAARALQHLPRSSCSSGRGGRPACCWFRGGGCSAGRGTARAARGEAEQQGVCAYVCA